jgi:L,D-peptidoglycan transpeptidase YkuD (ErfK/YbiS/YcfS/YnhG family)
MTSEYCTIIEVRKKPGGYSHHGLLSFADFTVPCLLGRSGITVLKQEGDGATPAGRWRIMHGMYRRDRLAIPDTRLSMSQILPCSGWCDKPDDANYNRPVKLPYTAGHEKLFRDDHLYDICLVLDYNIDPRVRNRGSAIFFHLSGPDGSPTAGCVAIDLNAMRQVLGRISDQTVLQIHC